MKFKEFLLEQERHQSSGTLHYTGNDRLVLNIDPGIIKLTINWMNKWGIDPKDYKLQAYAPHITVVRTGKEVPKNMEAWGKYEGREVDFEYDGTPYYDGTYYFLKAYSKELEKIREELGLTKIRPGFSEFHITVANSKGL